MYAIARSACARSLARSRGNVAPGPGGISRAVADGIWLRQRGARLDFRKQSTVVEASESEPTTSPPPKPKKPLYIRAPVALALTLLTFTLGFTMAAAPALPTALSLYQPPTDEETLSLFTPSTDELAEIERQIFEHPITSALLEDERYIASRPHLKIPEPMRAQNLTGGTLLGPDKIAVPPLQFTTEDGTEFVSLQYLGSALCGHPGIVHGGLLATLLDEGLARCCFPALPNKVAVTASLKIDYKAPAMAGQIVVLRATTTRVDGRKAWVTGHLETLADEKKGEKPIVLTRGEALFIEPRQAASMKRVVT
ncbi:Thioesterase/thiol ester dehydrase-isomerase [Lentithecium fluviatile CBS 122367]|uniref:Thioesterase/thiol ester dehydrase-isomerase n=1 Tax=Lentithecium fluviatile CBS 122367 TaxID=1168545 RepID=A0A6G1J8F4_9PLEO|nr:Thioesterase/thiol ester dehydrase-isomerase [Lentithecium fluviatile CBS 122367]